MSNASPSSGLRPPSPPGEKALGTRRSRLDETPVRRVESRSGGYLPANTVALEYLSNSREDVPAKSETTSLRIGCWAGQMQLVVSVVG